MGTESGPAEDPQFTAGKQAFLRLMTSRIAVDQPDGDAALLAQTVDDAVTEVFDPALSAEEQRARLTHYLLGVAQVGWQVVLASMLLGPEQPPLTDLDPADVPAQIADYWRRIAVVTTPADPHFRT